MMLIRAHCTVREGSVGYRMSVSEEHDEQNITPQTLGRRKRDLYTTNPKLKLKYIIVSEVCLPNTTSV